MYIDLVVDWPFNLFEDLSRWNIYIKTIKQFWIATN